MEFNGTLMLEVEKNKLEIMKKMAEAHLLLCKAMNAPTIEIKNCNIGNNSNTKIVKKKLTQKKKGK